MPRTAFAILLAAALAGCSAADASPYDSSNPVHCMTIFSVTSGTARTGPLADELNARILFFVRSHGGEPWLRQITPTSLQLAARWEASADRDAIMRLFDGCRARQDADPIFRAALPELMREARRISSNAR